MEPILMFVFIAIITSLFSKDKKQPRRRQTTTRPQVNPNNQENRIPTESRPQRRTIFAYDNIEEIESKYYHMKEEIKPKKPVNKLNDYKNSKKELEVIDVDTMGFEEQPSLDGKLLDFSPN